MMIATVTLFLRPLSAYVATLFLSSGLYAGKYPLSVEREDGAKRTNHLVTLQALQVYPSSVTFIESKAGSQESNPHVIKFSQQEVPSEVILYMAEYMPLEVLKKLTLVSKGLHHTLKHPYLWQQIVISHLGFKEVREYHAQDVKFYQGVHHLKALARHYLTDRMVST